MSQHEINRPADLQAEVIKLRERLEVFDSKGNRLPESADGIACRDETIKQQDERIEKLRERVKELEKYTLNLELTIRDYFNHKSFKDAWHVLDTVKERDRLRAALESAPEIACLEAARNLRLCGGALTYSEWYNETRKQALEC